MVSVNICYKQMAMSYTFIHICISFLIFTEPSENYALWVQYLRSDLSNADFDLYWRKCAAFRFKQIFETKCTPEIFALWPEYKKPAASQLVSYNLIVNFFP